MVFCSVCGSNHKAMRYKDKGIYCNKHRIQLIRFGKIFDRTVRDRNEIFYRDGYAEIAIYDKNSNIIAFSKISMETVDLVKNFKWRFGTKNYIISQSPKICLHRLIFKLIGIEVPKGHVIDHINRDKLDNRLENLRVVTFSENSHNSKMFSNNTTGYKGIYYNKLKNTYEACIGFRNKRYRKSGFKNILDAVNYRKSLEEQFILD